MMNSYGDSGCNYFMEAVTVADHSCSVVVPYRSSVPPSLPLPSSSFAHGPEQGREMSSSLDNAFADGPKHQRPGDVAEGSFERGATVASLEPLCHILVVI